MLKKIFLVLYFFFFMFLVVSPVAAHAQNWGGCVQNEDGAQVASLQCIPVVFSNLVNAALIFVGSVAVILLIYAGIRLITSGGDPKQVQAARQIITYAIIGLVIVLLSFAIIYVIAYLTNAPCIEKFSFTSCA
jgi:type IV secretion system pilin